MTEKIGLYHPKWIGITKIDDSELFYLNPESPQNFVDFNPIIILGGTLFGVEEGYKRVNEAVRREREIFNALEKGSVVCITFHIDDLLERVLKRIGKEIFTLEEPRADLRIKRSEFSSLLKKFGSAGYHFEEDFDDIICETEDGYVVGFAEKVGKGALVFLPCYDINIFDFAILKDFLQILLDGLRTYLPKIQYKPPNWINSLRFPNEAIIVSEVEKLQREINIKINSLEKYLELKEILWFRDDELVKSVMNFFKEIGIETKQDEIYEEDFWIVEQGKETVIVEVKGLDQNLTRPHISKLDEHRGARNKPDDFPALLVVNSFNRAESLKEKDRDISPNEIKKSVQTNVLILRTLDLCNVYSLMERKKLNPSTLLNVIKKENGWLNITASGLEIKKK